MSQSLTGVRRCRKSAELFTRETDLSRERRGPYLRGTGAPGSGTDMSGASTVLACVRAGQSWGGGTVRGDSSEVCCSRDE